jgi:hypothetical protein
MMDEIQRVYITEKNDDGDIQFTFFSSTLPVAILHVDFLNPEVGSYSLLKLFRESGIEVHDTRF